TGRSPASDSVALRERTHRDHGLDLATDLPQVPAGLRTAVLKATHPFVSNRLHDMRSFIAALAEAEKAADTRDQDSIDPLDQSPGTILDGRFELRRRLGAGSTAVALLAADTAKEGSPEVVLKVAIADSAARRLEGEAEV